jgi:hypothetical protein
LLISGPHLITGKMSVYRVLQNRETSPSYRAMNMYRLNGMRMALDERGHQLSPPL